MKKLIVVCFYVISSYCIASESFISYEGKAGPGKGKHVVLLSGDEEYRSEEAMPMLARILSEHHGFKTTVLFSLDKDGMIDPKANTDVQGIEAMDSADACIMLLRFRSWPEEKMKHFTGYLNAGKPFIALRTSTHLFQFPADSPYAHYDWKSKEKWKGGFGKEVFGETWVSHWGHHKFEATNFVIEATNAKHPILNGVKEIFGTTDVYETSPSADAIILARGQVLVGMKPTDVPATHSKKTKAGVEQPVNDPMMPILWTRDYKNEAGTTNKIVLSTMGAATDLEDEDLRRVVVNSVYWSLGMQVPSDAQVDTVGEYKPTFYGFNEHKKGLRPTDLK
jgi:hypothetical protein